MSFSISWDLSALETYNEEVAFILLKWNVKEVQKFKELVDENLMRLSLNPEIGVFNLQSKIYTLVISKQTTLHYDFDITKNEIELIVFWNNSQNPDDLAKLL